MRKTATIQHEPAYFNTVAYANIPESWTIFPDNGSPKLPCDSPQDAREVAERFGYIIRSDQVGYTSRFLRIVNQEGA